MSERKLRHQFYLDTRLSEKLEALSSKPGASKTSILTAALTNWIEQRGASEVEVRFAARLDRQQRVQQRLERKTDALIELVGVFVQHQMALVAHHPPFDPETAQLGKERFGSLLDLVERRLSNDGIVARLAKESEDAVGATGKADLPEASRGKFLES